MEEMDETEAVPQVFFFFFDNFSVLLHLRFLTCLFGCREKKKEVKFL